MSLHIKVPSYKLNNPANPGLKPSISRHQPRRLEQARAAVLRHGTRHLRERPSHSRELSRLDRRRPGGASSEGRAEEMGRAPCCDKETVKKGPWAPEEDAVLKAYIDEHGAGGNWIQLPHKIGRCKHRPVYRSSA